MQALTTLGDKVGLKFGQPAEAADQNAFAVTKGVRRQVPASRRCPTSPRSARAAWSSAARRSARPRPFCQPGLESKYGLKFDSFTSLDAGGPLSKTALKNGKVNIALVFSSDAALAG